MPLMVPKQVQFHGSLGRPLQNPAKDRSSPIDHSSVHTDQLVLETELAGLAASAWHWRNTCLKTSPAQCNQFGPEL
jgi:hypothetical protein